MKNKTIHITETHEDGTAKITFAPYDPKSKTVYLDVSPDKITYTTLFSEGLDWLPIENKEKREYILNNGKRVTPSYIMEVTPSVREKKKATIREGEGLVMAFTAALPDGEWKIVATFPSGGYTIMGYKQKMVVASTQILVKKNHPDDTFTVVVLRGCKTERKEMVVKEKLITCVKQIVAENLP